MGRGLKVARHAVAGAPHRRTASAAHVSLLRPHVQRQLPRSNLQEAIQTRSSLPALIARYPVVTGLRRLRNAMTPPRSRARSIDSSPDGRRAPVERSSNRYLKLNRIPQVRPATRSSLCTNQLSRWEPAPRRMGGQAPAVTRRSHGRPARPPMGSHVVQDRLRSRRLSLNHLVRVVFQQSGRQDSNRRDGRAGLGLD